MRYLINIFLFSPRLGTIVFLCARKSVCLSHFSFLHFFFFMRLRNKCNLPNSFKMSKNRSSYHFCSVWLTSFRENTFLYFIVLMFGFVIEFSVYWINGARVCGMWSVIVSGVTWNIIFLSFLTNNKFYIIMSSFVLYI